MALNRIYTRNSGCVGIRQRLSDNFKGLGEQGLIPWDDIISIKACNNCENQVYGGDLVFVAGDEFQMGCTEEQEPCIDTQYPVHTVSLNNFWIGKYEVTENEWMSIMGDTSPASWNYSGCGDCPMVEINWYDAVVYCNRLSVNEGKTPAYYSDSGYTEIYGYSGGTWASYPGAQYINGTVTFPTPTYVHWNQNANGYRLPTEAEWEYAARGGINANPTTYAGSNTINDVAWHGTNSGSVAHPVGGKMPNELGLYDMSGNIWEWCWDVYGYYYYSSSPGSNPTGPISESNFPQNIMRGGSFFSIPQLCTASNRAFSTSVSRNPSLGFRISANSLGGGDFTPQSDVTCYDISIDTSYFEDSDISDIVGNIVGEPIIYYGIGDDVDTTSLTLYNGEIEYDGDICGKNIFFRIEIEFDSGYCINDTYSETICCCESCNPITLNLTTFNFGSFCNDFAVTLLRINPQEDVPYQIIINGTTITYNGSAYYVDGVEANYNFVFGQNFGLLIDVSPIPTGTTWEDTFCSALFGNTIYDISQPFEWTVVGYNCIECQSATTSTCSADINIPSDDIVLCDVAFKFNEVLFSQWVNQFSYETNCDCNDIIETLNISIFDGVDTFNFTFNGIELEDIIEISEIYLIGNCNITIDGTYIVESNCFDTISGDSTLIIASNLPLTVECPQNETFYNLSCTSDELNNSFNSWINNFSYSGGTGVINEFFGSVPPLDICGGEIVQEYYAVDDLGVTAQCSSIFTIINEQTSSLIEPISPPWDNSLPCEQNCENTFETMISVLNGTNDTHYYSVISDCPFSAVTTIDVHYTNGTSVNYITTGSIPFESGGSQLNLLGESLIALPPCGPSRIVLSHFQINVQLIDSCGNLTSSLHIYDLNPDCLILHNDIWAGGEICAPNIEDAVEIINETLNGTQINSELRQINGVLYYENFSVSSTCSPINPVTATTTVYLIINSQLYELETYVIEPDADTDDTGSFTDNLIGGGSELSTTSGNLAILAGIFDLETTNWLIEIQTTIQSPCDNVLITGNLNSKVKKEEEEVIVNPYSNPCPPCAISPLGINYGFRPIYNAIHSGEPEATIKYYITPATYDILGGTYPDGWGSSNPDMTDELFKEEIVKALQVWADFFEQLFNITVILEDVSENYWAQEYSSSAPHSSPNPSILWPFPNIYFLPSFTTNLMNHGGSDSLPGGMGTSIIQVGLTGDWYAELAEPNPVPGKFSALWALCHELGHACGLTHKSCNLQNDRLMASQMDIPWRVTSPNYYDNDLTNGEYLTYCIYALFSDPNAQLAGS